MCDHSAHEYVRARQRKTRDVNFETSNYFTAVELLIVSEASFLSMWRVLARTVHAAALGPAQPI